MLWTRESGREPALDGFGREVLGLALPAFGALVAPSALLLTDAAFVGSLGTRALAGYAGGSAVFGVASGLSYFLAYASTGVVARRYGAGQHREAVRDGVNYMTLGVGIGLLVALVFWRFAITLGSWIGVSSDVLPYTADWLHGAAFGAPAVMASMAAVGLFRGLQDTRVTLRITLFQVAVNMLLCWVFVFPAHMGTFGAGLAVSLAESLGLLGYVVVLLRHARSTGASARPSHLRGLGRAFVTGMPLLLRSFSLRTVLMGTTVVAARLGDHELAAFQVSLTVWYALSNLLDALAIAAQAMVGRRLGASEGHLVHELVGRLARWAIGSGAVIGAITMLLAPVAPFAFSGDPEVRHLLLICLLIVGVHQPLASAVFLLDGVLIGSGDGRFLAYVVTVAMFVFLPIAWAVLHFHLGVIGLWGAMIAFLTTRVLLLVQRARTDAWIIEGASR